MDKRRHECRRGRHEQEAIRDGNVFGATNHGTTTFTVVSGKCPRHVRGRTGLHHLKLNFFRLLGRLKVVQQILPFRDSF